MKQDKILAYACAYLESKINEHETFLNNFKGDKTSLVQYTLVERYKQELKELEYQLSKFD